MTLYTFSPAPLPSIDTGTSPNGAATANLVYDTSGRTVGVELGGKLSPLFTADMMPRISGVNDEYMVIGMATLDGVYQSFLLVAGKITPINMPGSVMQGWATVGSGGAGTTALPPLNSTRVSGINDAGEVVGYFVGSDGNTHGFSFINGVYTQIDVPGAMNTAIWAVDANGGIMGSSDAFGSGSASGFMGNLVPPSGPGGGVSSHHFLVADQTIGTSEEQSGEKYSGPVAGITQEMILVTDHNVNITAEMPNVFIHSGSGEDAIDVSHQGGNNILDGATGSNFLVGGSGNDSFFIDDRQPVAALWSTIVGGHSGETVTIWGVTKADFGLAMQDNMGATGYQGLTLTTTRAGSPTAMTTLAGFTQADIASGKLSVDYGHSPDTTGLAGSDYMAIHIR